MELALFKALFDKGLRGAPAVTSKAPLITPGAPTPAPGAIPIWPNPKASPSPSAKEMADAMRKAFGAK